MKPAKPKPPDARSHEDGSIVVVPERSTAPVRFGGLALLLASGGLIAPSLTALVTGGTGALLAVGTKLAVGLVLAVMGALALTLSREVTLDFETGEIQVTHSGPFKETARRQRLVDYVEQEDRRGSVSYRRWPKEIRDRLEVFLDQGDHPQLPEETE